MNATDDNWMRVALDEARKAFELDEVPVGACIIMDGKVIGRGHNLIEQLNDPTAHAEIIAIGAATSTLGSRYLNNTTMYVSLEPCLMCCGAIIQARIEKLVFGARDPKAGAVVSLYNVLSDARLNH
ncbi:MAG: nucleoside deaminase, partial [Candidatus Glassbacteria bacterium]